MMHVTPGFNNPDSLQTFRVFIPETLAKSPEQVIHTEQAINDRLATMPGVSGVSFTTDIPMSGSSSNDPIYAEDHAYKAEQLPPVRRFKFVAPGSFSTIGTPLIAGRDYTWEETYRKAPVAILSEDLAREYWGNPAAAIGKRIRVASNDDWREVVGVVGDVHDDGVSQPAPKTVYWPVFLSHFEGNVEDSRRNVAFTVRSGRAGSEAFHREIQRTVWSVDSNLPLADVRTLGYYYKRSMARTSFTLIMLSVAGAMALLLGVVGIYGVISYSVSQRTREIGIRMALGAQRQAITAMFVRHGLLLTGIGVGIGLAASVVTMRLMSSLLFNVSPADPMTYATITVCILAIAWIACYLPSRRAATVEPANALRAE
jgi:predicted permease